MERANSFSEILIDRAKEFPGRTVFSFLEDGVNITSTLTFSELDLAARAAAATLSEHAKQGSRAILVYPPGLDFIVALFGCFYAGIIAVPLRCHKKTPFNKIIDQTEPACIVGRTELFDRGWLGKHNAVEISHQQLIAKSADQFSLCHHNIAVLQYTSGSTSSPKGVMISHANLLDNSKNIKAAFGLCPGTVAVSWLPHYHDMGLIDGILQPVFAGYSSYLFPATAFLNRPITWLQIISRFRADHSGGPDFAYAHCVNAAPCEELDLSCWRSAYNGSEPIRQKTIEDFVNKFSSCGFKKHYFFPCYGLAESTLMVSGGKMEEEPQYLHVDREALSRNEIVQCAPGVSLVSAGQACSKLAIVDTNTFKQLAEAQVGEIWLAGESVSAGYWQNESEVFNAFINNEGPFLRTGDLGFLFNGSLYVTGRIKDMIIIRGVNYYAPDIEENIRTCHPQIAGNVAAFRLEQSGKENLAIALEVNRQFIHSCDVQEIVQRVRRIVAEQFEIEVYLVMLLKPQGIPVTTSGKIKRYACEQLFLSGDTSIIHSSCLYTTLPAPEPPDLSKWNELSITEKQLQVKQYLLSSLNNDVEQSFASIGLDSLQTTKLVHQLNRDWNCSLTAQDLTGRIEQLIPLLCQQAGTKQDTGAANLSQYSPASAGQVAQWFLNKLQEGVYDVSIALHLSGELNAHNLERAVEAVVARHHALRTVFSLVDQELLQITLPCRPNVIEWRENDTFNPEANKPFDLQTGPLFRVVVWKISPGEHILQLIAHHSVVDLHSAEIIIKEIFSSELNPVKFQAADFARWQHEYLQSRQARKSLSYWLDQLNNVPPLRFPTISGKAGSSAGATFPGMIDALLAKEIRTFATRAGVTPYVLLLAIYQVFLHRYCRANDLIVGSSISYRHHPKFENTVGYLVNQIALRGRFENDPSFNQFLQTVKATVRDGMAHGDYPYAHLIKHLANGVDRPEFQTMFNFESISPNEGIRALAAGVKGAALNIDQLTISSIPYTSQRAQFDIRLNCIEHSAGISCAWEYRTGLFNAAANSMIHEHFVNLVKAAIKDPQLQVSRLKLPEQSIPSNNKNIASACITSMFEACVRKCADAVAIKASLVQLTYAQLNERANQLSHYLTNSGIGMEDVVGICLHRSPEMLIAMLATWKAGAACLPLDPTLPQARLAYMAENAGCKLIISEEFLEQHPISQQPTENPSNKNKTNSLAYILYTSGSTGKPKGVMIEHGGLANYLTWCAEKYDLSKGEGAVVSSSFAFDATLTTLLGPLVCGTSVILIPETNETGALIELMHSGRDISVVKLTPSKLRLIESLVTAQDNFSVRTFIVGGEALAGRDVVFWRNYAPQLRIINEYGPTETVVGSTTYEIDDNTPLDSAIPIGTPIFNTKIFVLDDNLQPVPPMVEGELYIGGIGVARGYINSPQQTNERFLPDHGRIFKTGDLAKYDHNGMLHYCGRRDEQVKIRGARVELTEVEIAIRSLDFINDAVVALRNDALVAYICVNNEFNYLAIRNALLDQLPAYMVPTHFIAVKEFPISSSGKIDRHALAKLPLHENIPQIPLVETSLEKQITAAWSEVLGKPVSRHENFFDLGGDSLLAGVLQHKLSKIPGVQVSITDLFRYPTVALLALGLRGAATNSASSDDIQLRVHRRKQALSKIDKKITEL